MSIKSVGGFTNILNKGETSEWVRHAEFSELNPKINLKNSPDSPVEISKSQKSFSEFLADSVVQVNSLQTKANEAVQKLVTGESKNIHETMLQIEQADLAFRSMNQIRLKVLDAYKEVMRMQV